MPQMDVNRTRSPADDANSHNTAKYSEGEKRRKKEGQ